MKCMLLDCTIKGFISNKIYTHTLSNKFHFDFGFTVTICHGKWLRNINTGTHGFLFLIHMKWNRLVLEVCRTYTVRQWSISDTILVKSHILQDYCILRQVKSKVVYVNITQIKHNHVAPCIMPVFISLFLSAFASPKTALTCLQDINTW